MTKRKALFLDRDGTLIHDAHYLKDPEKVEIIEGISESIKLVREQGFLLLCIPINRGSLAAISILRMLMHVTNECIIFLLAG